jgi:hypothetical protein
MEINPLTLPLLWPLPGDPHNLPPEGLVDPLMLVGLVDPLMLVVIHMVVVVVVHLEVEALPMA